MFDNNRDYLNKPIVELYRERLVHVCGASAGPSIFFELRPPVTGRNCTAACRPCLSDASASLHFGLLASDKPSPSAWPSSVYFSCSSIASTFSFSSTRPQPAAVLLPARDRRRGLALLHDKQACRRADAADWQLCPTGRCGLLRLGGMTFAHTASSAQVRRDLGVQQASSSPRRPTWSWPREAPQLPHGAADLGWSYSVGLGTWRFNVLKRGSARNLSRTSRSPARLRVISQSPCKCTKHGLQLSAHEWVDVIILAFTTSFFFKKIDLVQQGNSLRSLIFLTSCQVDASTKCSLRFIRTPKPQFLTPKIMHWCQKKAPPLINHHYFTHSLLAPARASETHRGCREYWHLCIERAVFGGRAAFASLSPSDLMETRSDTQNAVN